MKLHLGARRLGLAARGALIRGAGLLCAFLPATVGQGVTISGSTYAANTNGQPPPSSTSMTFNLTNPTSVSDSIRSDVTYSHAQAWASATVTCLGVTKTTGGRGWADTSPIATAPFYDNKANLWSAYASGTQVVANYTGKGTAPQFTPFNFAIPGDVASQFNAFPGNGPGDPATLTPPSSGIGFVVNGGGGGAGSLPSFFDISLQIDATAQQGSGQPVDLFHGTLLFDPGALTFQTTGGFAGISPVVTPGPISGQYFVSFPTIQGGTFNATVGQPFQTNFNVYMTMGDPNRQFDPNNQATFPVPFNFSTMSGGTVGAVGAFASSVLANDPSNFMVSVVPDAPAAVNVAWNGGGANGNWGNAANWVGGAAPVAKNALVFDGDVNLATINDFAPNTQFNGIKFASSAGSFTLNGNSIVLTGDINDNSTNPQTINVHFLLSGGASNFNVAAGGSLVLNDSVVTDGVASTFNVAAGGSLLLNNSLTFNGGTSDLNVASGGSLALTSLRFGSVPQANVTALNVNNTVSATSLQVQTNNPASNTINIAGGATFNIVNGAVINAIVLVGTSATTPSTVTTSLAVSGSGTLNVGPTSGNFTIGVGSGNNAFGGFSATLDMSGLANFVYNGTGGGNFYVGFGTRPIGTVHLANTSNSITANDLTVGDSNQTPGFPGIPNNNNAGGAPSNLFLGAGTNIFNLGGTLMLGNTKASGNLQFENASGSVAINGLDPQGNPGQVPNIVVSRMSAGSGTGTSNLLLAGHTASVQTGTVSIGVVAGSSGTSTGNVSFDTGTFNAATLNVAVHSSGTGAAVGTFTLGGPTPDTIATGVLNVGTALNLANRTTGGASADAGTLIINGGTANVNADIVDASASNAGPRTTTLTLAGGTLNMMGHAIGSTTAPITNTNFVVGGGQATLKNLGGGGINGIGLTISGQGQLLLDGVNNYSGNTTIVTGTLSVIGSITGSPGGSVNVIGGTLGGNGNLNTTGFIGEPVNVGGGSVRAGTTPGDVGQLATAGLTFHNGNLTVDLGPSFTNDVVKSSNGLTIGDTPASQLALTVTGTYGIGSYNIINYTGPLIKNSDFAISGPLGFTYSLDYGFPGNVLLHVQADPSVLRWTGAQNSNWDFATPNFTRGAGNLVYAEPATVAFTDISPAAASTITILQTVLPAVISVASSKNNFTFQGPAVIAGTGTLIKDGSSTLTLLTNNTYSGGTNIKNGTIRVGNGGSTGSLGPGQILNNGILAYNRADDIVVGNPIAGTGSLQKLGAGTLILTANNSFGATTILAGTVQVGNGGTNGSLGTGPITISDGASLVFHRSDNVNLSNTISGSGTLSIAGPGTVTLSGVNNLTGGVSVGQGGVYSTNFLPAGGGAAGGGGGPPGGAQPFTSALPAGTIVLNGGTLQYTGPAVTSSDSITLGPTVDTLDASGAANAALVLSKTSPIAFSSTASPITLTLTGASTGANTLAAAITDPGTSPKVMNVVKNGTGTWVLTGADSYTGGTVVNHGTLRLLLTGGAVMGAVPAMVNHDATLEVANSTPALTDTPVINNSTAAAGLLISGTCLEIKSIDGTGKTQVNAGGEVTTDHIVQGALIILGTSTNTTNVEITASDASGNPLASDSSVAFVRDAGSPMSSGSVGPSGIGQDSVGANDPSLGALSTDAATAGSMAVPEPATATLAVILALFAAVRGLITVRQRGQLRRNAD